MRRSLLKKLMMSAVLAGGLLVAGSGTATFAQGRQRDFRQACATRLQSARARLDSDVARFGPRDRRVERDRGRLQQTREWCRSRHAEWDHDRYDRD